MIGRLQVAKYLYASINANDHVLLDVDAECLFIIIMLTLKGIRLPLVWLAEQHHATIDEALVRANIR